MGPKLLLASPGLDPGGRLKSVWSHIHVLGQASTPVRTDSQVHQLQPGRDLGLHPPGTQVQGRLFGAFQPKGYRAELMELRVLRQDLKREVRKLWFDRQRRSLEIPQMEREGAGLAEEKLKVKLAVRAASISSAEPARLSTLGIETQVLERILRKN